MNLTDLAGVLSELSRVDAPAGHEGPLRRWLQAHLPPQVTARVDGLGNLIVTPADAASVEVLVVAPLDEVGFLAQPGPAPGWLRLAPLGPAPTPGPAGARVRFVDGARGVLTRDPAAGKAQGWDAWLCDVGPAPVPVGQPAVWDTDPVVQGDRVLGKAVGVRAALLAAYLPLHTARPRRATAWVFAAREQVMGHGSAPAAFGLQPRYALRVVPAPAGDEPGRRVPGLRLAGGPGLRRREWGRAADARLVAWLTRLARAARLAVQDEVPQEREPSWAALPLVAAGVPTVTLSIPTRNLHAAHQAVALPDVQTAARWLQAALEDDGDPLA